MGRGKPGKESEVMQDLLLTTFEGIQPGNLSVCQVWSTQIGEVLDYRGDEEQEA